MRKSIRTIATVMTKRVANTAMAMYMTSDFASASSFFFLSCSSGDSAGVPR